MAGKFTFSHASIKELTPPCKNREYYQDAKQTGFRLAITSKGTITFQCKAWSNAHKKTITVTLGKFPTLDVATARKLAAETMTAIQTGRDLEQQRQEQKAESTFSDIFDRYMKQHAKPHKKSWKSDEDNYRLYIKKPFGNKKVSTITTDQVRSWHNKTGNINGIYVANRALATLRVVYNTCLDHLPNPARKVKQFKEQSRDRFLQPSELANFFKAVSEEQNKDIADYIMLSLFTGARRTNVLSMKWKDIDLDTQTWKIPATESKNAESISIPLINEALEILQVRKKHTSSFFVFPGRGKSGHLSEPKRGWLRICIAAGLTEIVNGEHKSTVRLHDLRRTMGSYQTMTGASTTIVGKTLGHKSHQATAIYSRMNLDPVRTSMEKAAEAMLGAAVSEKNKVVKISEG